MFYGSPHILLYRHKSQDIQLRVMTNTLVRLFCIQYKHKHDESMHIMLPVNI